MANPYPAEFQTTSRDGRGLIVRIGGVLDFTDPSNQPGGGSGNMVVQAGLDNEFFSDTVTTVALDGSAHGCPFTLASPPSWLDASGNILDQGLYLVGMVLAVGTPATSTNKWVVWRSPFAAGLPVCVDPVQSFQVKVIDVTTLATADLPYSVGASLDTQTDATGTILATPTVSQLASVS